jgi:D-amino-acid dehydrogenase
MKKCIIIGGGIIGLCTAYYLQKEGYRVTVIDQSNMDGGASYVNAGYISPSHFVPLSAPGVVKKGIQWMFDPSSPFYVKPRTDLDFLKWAWAFNKSCNPAHVKRSIPVIRDIAVMSHELYEDLEREEGFDFHFEKKGLLMMCQTEKMLEQEIKLMEIAKELDLEAVALDQKAVQKLEPNVKLNVAGATFYKCDSHTTPHEFMANMKNYLVSHGVEILKNEKVVDIEIKDGIISGVKTDRRTYTGDEYILSAGSWTGLVAKKLGMNLLLQAGKGYRINVTRKTGIAYPAILAEAKAAVTPMNGFTRFAGTMEIAGINQDLNLVRIEAIAKAVSSYYPEVEINEDEKLNASSGLRPLSPDGVPYIGRSSKCKNLTIATGHAMMGYSMATGTGKLVSEIISERPLSMDMGAFSPDRKF